MSNPFFDHPILNSPYERPRRHWELAPDGQPTHQTLETRRPSAHVSPIPKPRKRKGGPSGQSELALEHSESAGLSTSAQRYDPTPIINLMRGHLEQWRALPSTTQWNVTPETARLLTHWRTHRFANQRPFYCQIEAVEAVIWLSEVAPHLKIGKRVLDHVAAANHEANPELVRIALKEKKATMETYWVPGVNHLGTHGRWAFAELTQVYEIESDFKQKIESRFDEVVASALRPQRPGTETSGTETSP